MGQMVQGQESSSILCRVVMKGNQTGKQSGGQSTPNRKAYKGHSLFTHTSNHWQPFV